MTEQADQHTIEWAFSNLRAVIRNEREKVRHEERERCAKIAESMEVPYLLVATLMPRPPRSEEVQQQIAAAIRREPTAKRETCQFCGGYCGQC